MPAPPSDDADRVVGDQSAVRLPADPAALGAGGTDFLTEAFRAAGALDDGNAVARITQFQEVPGGSTGRKLLLSVEYQRPQPGLHRDLFVKFSRDLDDPARDRGKNQMESEVRFASLSRAPGFPIAVPRPLFADYHRDTGTGILITERILFGRNGTERQYHKCRDDEMPEPLAHYRALLTALGRLVGYHRSGRLPADTAAEFPVDLQAATVGERAPVNPESCNGDWRGSPTSRTLTPRCSRPTFARRSSLPAFIEKHRTYCATSPRCGPTWPA